jgi:hypothetical protein
MLAVRSYPMVRFLRRLVRDEGGAVLIYVSIGLTVFMGFAALVIDGGRLFAVDTEMQSAADALALAGAAELDGTTDAQERATLAMANLVQNDQRFADGAHAITGFTPRFLSELPDDDLPLSDATVAVGDEDSRFVEVRLTNRDVGSIFATAIGGEDETEISAVAVAGFTSAVCQFTPLFMCNPYEDTGESLLDKVGDPAEQRKLIELKRSGSGASYDPGNFGFLDSVSDDTSFRNSLAKIDPGACFRSDGVNTKPGSTVSARQPLNTRFDLWEGSFNNPSKYRNNALYRPARNVTKGMVAPNSGQVCNPDPQPTAMAFPVDSTFNANRMGNGDWGGAAQFDLYWSTNHPGVTNPWTYSDRPSRYDVYRWEIDNDEIPDNWDLSPKGEDGNPQCSSSAVNDTPDRRVIYAAVINCNEHDSLLNGGSGRDIPVVAFVKMFMALPMSKTPGHDKNDESVAADNTLYVEMIDIVKPGVDDAVVHDIVQLYR